MHGFLKKTGVLLLAVFLCSVRAQGNGFGPPTITAITPGNRQAIISFIPPSNDGNPIREYVTLCVQPNAPEAGIFEITTDVEDLAGNRITLAGLNNGETYVCSMTARAVSGGMLPRAINSPPSQPTPPFKPSVNGGPSIFTAVDSVPSPTTTPSEASPSTTPSVGVSEEPSAAPNTTSTPAPFFPAAPVILSAEPNAAADSLTLSWSPIAGPALLTGYAVSCESVSAVAAFDSSTASTVNVAADVTSVTVEGLSPGDYVCSVAATVQDGVGRAALQMASIPEQGSYIPDPVLVPEVSAPAESEIAAPAVPAMPAAPAAPQAPSSAVQAAVTGSFSLVIVVVMVMLMK